MHGLHTLNKKSTLSLAIDALRGYIIDNKLKEGDRLPTENTFSSSLGISRNIIREAMQYFKTLGIVETRPKTGALVSRLLPENPFKNYQPFLLNDPQCLREAAEMRMVLECGAASLMIENCTEEDIGLLESQVSQMEDYSRRAEHDMAFHSTLLRLTRNRLIESMIPLTVEFFNSSPLGQFKKSEIPRIVREHREILAALSARDKQELCSTLGRHYRVYMKDGDCSEKNRPKFVQKPPTKRRD